MKDITDLTPIPLFAFGVLSILTGMLLFEMTCLAEQLPAWGLLLPFFSLGVVYKVIEQLNQRENALRFPTRIVTVEFDWSLVPQEV